MSFNEIYAIVVILVVLVLPELVFYLGVPMGASVMIPNPLPFLIAKITIAAILIGVQYKIQKNS